METKYELWLALSAGKITDAETLAQIVTTDDSSHVREAAVDQLMKA